jgi:rod shape-determining protein MreB
MAVRGRDLVSGLPRTLVISAVEARNAITEPVAAIIDAIKYTLEKTPPELASDVMETGIMLTGGGALLDGFAELISIETGIPVRIAHEPINCVALGTGMVLDHIRHMKSVLITPKKLKL